MKTCTSLFGYYLKGHHTGFYVVFFLVLLFQPGFVDAQVKCLPVLTCENRVVLCSDSAAALVGDPGYAPEVVSDCPNRYELVATSWPEQMDCSSEYIRRIIRMWRVKGDPTVLCIDTTFVLRIDFDEVECPTDGRDTVHCGDTGNAIDSLQIRAPYFVLDDDTVRLVEGIGDLCGVYVKLDTTWWNLCGNTGSQMRVWTIKDDCGNEMVCYDTIIVIDTVPPDIDIETSGLTYEEHDINGVVDSFWTDTISMSSHDCVGYGLAPYALVTDNCSNLEGVKVTIKTADHIIIGQYYAHEVVSIPLYGISNEKQILRYIAQDQCGHTSEDTVVIVPTDNVAATAVCHGAVNLSLTNIDEFSFLQARSMDSESSDNCAIYQVLARRKDWQEACGYNEGGVESSIGKFYQHQYDWLQNDGGICQGEIPFGYAREVPFCCEDVGESIMVELLVIDYNCNVDVCWGYVNVEDKLPPIVVQPLGDVTISCNAYNRFYKEMFENEHTGAIQDNFGQYVVNAIDPGTFSHENISCDGTDAVVINEYSNGTVRDNCGTLLERYTLPQEGCSTGHILREFYSMLGPDEHLVASQKIYVERCPLDLEAVYLPVTDTTVYGCGVTFGLDGKVTIETPAPILPDTEDGCGQYAVGCYDKVFDLVGEGCKKVIRTWCVVDWCELTGGLDWASLSKDPGTVTFEQYITVVDSVPPTVTPTSLVADIDAASCSAQLSATIDATDGCGVEPFVRWALRNGANALVSSGVGKTAAPGTLLPPDVYTLFWAATDNCNNSTEVSNTFKISSDALPNMVAYSSLTTTLNPMDLDNDGILEGMATIQASAFNSSSTPTCGGNPDNLLFLIAPGHADETSTVPAASDTSLVFTCNDYSTSPTMIPAQFWVRDLVNETADYLNVMILLYDNHNVCGSSGSNASVTPISGQITTATDDMIANVNVLVRSVEDEVSVNTDYSGTYATNMVVRDGTADIIPVKDSDAGNGISTMDLIRVQRHILGLRYIANPYQLIAADVNRDGKVNPIDLVQMRSVLLGKMHTFPSNTSWRFLDAQYQFPYTEKALEHQYPEEIKYNETNSRALQTDFIGIKIGDVNGDAITTTTSSRAGKEYLSIYNQQLKEGDRISLAVYYLEANKLEGLQTVWKVDPTALEIVAVSPASMNITKEMYHITTGSIRLSWVSDHERLMSGEPLFYLEMKAKDECEIRDVISLTTEQMKSQIYLQGESTFDLGLKVVGAPQDDVGLQLSVQPNPFRQQTMIRFSLAQPGSVTLTLYDVTGRILHRQDGYFAKGPNSIMVDGSKLHPGILYCEIRTAETKETKRLVFLK